MNNQIPQTADAHVWAEEFLKAVQDNPAIATDKGTMICWFSNSIMAGYDLAQKRARQDKDVEVNREVVGIDKEGFKAAIEAAEEEPRRNSSILYKRRGF